MKYIVRDGLIPVEFEGERLAVVSTEVRWVDRWVELELYKVPPQPDPTGRIGLPSGGYITHVIGQSVRAHVHDSACNTGVPVQIRDLPSDAVPCADCSPDFPVCMDSEDEDEVAAVRAERSLLSGVFDLESARHTVHRSVTAGETVRRVTGRALSTPAQRLLEIAATIDPEIAGVIAA